MLDLLRPPEAASFLLRLFAGEPDFPQVEGDLREEFNQVALQSGPNTARQWYWNEALRNMRAFITRRGSINVLGAAAFGIALFSLLAPLYFRWLRYELTSVPRMRGLGFFLMTLSEMAFWLVSGLVLGRVLTGRGPMLRLVFTGFYLLRVTFFILTSGIYTWWLKEPIQIGRGLVGLIGVITSFWIGSAWSERHDRKRFSFF